MSAISDTEILDFIIEQATFGTGTFKGPVMLLVGAECFPAGSEKKFKDDVRDAVIAAIRKKNEVPA